MFVSLFFFFIFGSIYLSILIEHTQFFRHFVLHIYINTCFICLCHFIHLFIFNLTKQILFRFHFLYWNIYSWHTFLFIGDMMKMNTNYWKNSLFLCLNRILAVIDDNRYVQLVSNDVAGVVHTFKYLFKAVAFTFFFILLFTNFNETHGLLILFGFILWFDGLRGHSNAMIVILLVYLFSIFHYFVD